jgi:uncharacterized protein
MSTSTLPDLIQQMLQPEFYPHPVNEPIELMQTHASYILLTGDFAYKLKKPVNFGFLDYSTVERRQQFCEAEIILNQRGAKELYLEVLPISEASGQYALGDDGEIVDYTVKMVQFPQENLLSNMFEMGTISVADIETIGRVVAQFHQAATTSDYISNFGQVSKIKQSIDENYEQTKRYIDRAQTQSQYDETKAYTDRFFSQRPELFTARREGGFIRECHGDLHLRNICRWEDRILLFDCIEFNETYRFVDTMYDIGFAVMDLEARGRRDLANRFLNVYTEQTGDWEGLQVLPLYLSRQAYVRAKVTSLLLDDPNIPPADRDAAVKTASDYYHQAWAYTKPRQGKIIMLAGVSGSGKSTLGKQLAAELNAVHLRSDAVRKHLAGVPLMAKGDESIYTDKMTKLTYMRLLEIGTKLAAQGYVVILDAKYDRVALRQLPIDMAAAQHIPVEMIHCTAPVSVLRDRLNQRTGDIADATAALLESQLAQWEDFTPAQQALVTTVDTTK